MTPAGCARRRQRGSQLGWRAAPAFCYAASSQCLHGILSTTLLPPFCRPAGVQDWTHGWRLSLGLAAVPALVLLAGGILLPESPNSLIER